jgi:hypothetical protein
METPVVSDLKAYPTCKICDRGTLVPRKIRRLSGPAVAIGYILLIPSILGLVFCAILLIGILLVGITAAHGSSLATALAGSGSIAIVLIGIGCFVGGLLGWLLVMKKHVLLCDNCGAVVDAAAAINSHPNRSIGRTVVFGFSFLLLTLVAMAVMLTHRNTYAPDNTTEEPADVAKPTSNSVPAFSYLSMPDRVGQCSITSVKEIETRLGGTPGSGSAIEFTNGGYQVSYDTVPAIEKSLPGDQVKFCLVSIPANCPAGDARGREYKTENLRTGESWTLPDSEHECGGA